MDTRMCHSSFWLLGFSIILQTDSLQAIEDVSLRRNEAMTTSVATHETRKAIISGISGISTVASSETGNKIVLPNASANWETFATTVNTSNFSTLSRFAPNAPSPHTEAATSQVELTNETKRLPAESFSNSVSQVTDEEESIATTSSTTKWKLTASVRTASLFSSKVLYSVSSSQNPAAGACYGNSDVFLPIGLAIVLSLTILGFVVCILKKYTKQRAQYSHHPLCDASSESVDRYATEDDDTLVISGGLYDAPRVYNPNMTVYEDDELQTDHLTYNAQPGQVRLEFLPSEKGKRIFSPFETIQIPSGIL